MSIFNPAVFFSTPFVEEIEYYLSGVTEPVVIDAIVTRHNRKPFSNKTSDSQQIIYPVEIMIKRSDVLTISVKRDRVTVTNNRGVEDTVTIQEVLSCDDGVWNLGAI